MTKIKLFFAFAPLSGMAGGGAAGSSMVFQETWPNQQIISLGRENNSDVIMGVHT